jgi:hypothetical protein
MYKQVIAAVLGAGAALGLVLALSAPASNSHAKVDAAGCYLTEGGKTVCNGYRP